MRTCVVNRRYSVFDYYVGRPSCFGNPYTHLAHRRGHNPNLIVVASRIEAINCYREYFYNNIYLQQQALYTLYGARLGCWCAPLPCHADVIAEFVNLYYGEWPW